MNHEQLREAILGKTFLKVQAVPCPEWGVTVHIREMTGRERDDWEQSLAGNGKKPDIRNVRARLVSYTAVDADGNRIFAPNDADKLGGLSAKALDRCAKVAQKLNGLTDDDIEDARGNSSGVPSASSSSSSQATSGE